MIAKTPLRLRAWLAAAAIVASAPALALEPFTADYQASYMGLSGTGEMSLARQDGDRWKYSLDIKSGGAQLSQSTVFENKNGQWRPLSGRDSSFLLIKKTDKNATYDWSSGTARWSGDVKPDRAGPVKLQPGDLDALLINLAIPRDLAAGKPLRYRMVDDGRAKQLAYQVVGKENITFEGRTREATKVMRDDGKRQLIAWVVEGLPVPARILQRKDGRDDIDLRIKSVR